MTVFNFDNHRDFLRHWVEKSIEQKGKEFGYRNLSLSLKWPPTYLNDVVNYRKPLSVAKAWEIALHLGLNSTERDYLVTLTLKESKSQAVRDHAKRAIAGWKKIKPVVTTHPDPALHFNILIPLVLRVLSLLPPDRRTELELVSEFRKLPIGSQFNEAEIVSSLKHLEELKLISFKAPLYTIDSWPTELVGEHVKEKSSTWNMRDLYHRYALCWLKFIENRREENFHLKSSFCVLTLEQMRMIANKIDELRDLTMSFDEQNAAQIPPDTLRLVQYNYNLLELKGAPPQ
jgi:hypothetical protein